MPVKINGATSGSVTLAAPATGSDVTVTLPAAAGTVQTVPGAWTAYTPTISSESGTFTTVSGAARYSQVGKSVTVSFAITITTAGTASGQLRFTLPVTAQDSNSVGAAREKNATGTMCQVAAFDTSTVFILTNSNTSIIGSGRLVIGTYVYEAA